MLANEYSIIELLEEYIRKHGIFDDHLREHINKLKTYRMNLEIIEKKLIGIAANHMNL